MLTTMQKKIKTATVEQYGAVVENVRQKTNGSFISK